jgi:hypothetical protein
LKDLTLLLYLLFILTALGSLPGCEAPDTDFAGEKNDIEFTPDPNRGGRGPITESASWKNYKLPVDNSKAGMGGIDFQEDSAGFLHAAVTLKYLDVNDGATRYALYYFHNRFGYWTKITLKKSPNRFFKVADGYTENNFVRLIFDQREEPLIYYIDTSNQLVQFRNLVPKVLMTNVGSFAVARDPNNGNIHLAHMDTYWKANRIEHRIFKDDVEIYKIFSYGNYTATYGQPHIEMLLDNGRHTILYKIYNAEKKTGQFMMIHNSRNYILGNGVYKAGVFNAYIKDQVLTTCMKNVLDQRIQLTLDLRTMIGRKKTIPYQRNYKSPYQCMVSGDPDYPFARYNNAYGWSSYFEFYNFDHNYEGQTGKLPVYSLTNVKWHRGHLWVGGLDKNDLSPLILKKD